MLPEPDPAAQSWLDRERRSEMWTSSVTVMELETGIGRLDPGRRKDHLWRSWNALLADGLGGRIAPFDEDAAHATARLIAARGRVGFVVDIRDAQIAGIAISRGATLATRNTRHFRDLSTPVVDPWQA